MMVNIKAAKTYCQNGPDKNVSIGHHQAPKTDAGIKHDFIHT